jgi:hypothetical protein
MIRKLNESQYVSLATLCWILHQGTCVARSLFPEPVEARLVECFSDNERLSAILAKVKLEGYTVFLKTVSDKLYTIVGKAPSFQLTPDLDKLELDFTWGNKKVRPRVKPVFHFDVQKPLRDLEEFEPEDYLKLSCQTSNQRRYNYREIEKLLYQEGLIESLRVWE